MSLSLDLLVVLLLAGQLLAMLQLLSGLDSTGIKLQALVYHILPSITAVFSYAIGSRKLSANEQGLFFVVVVGGGGGAQTVVMLLQTTQIKQGV